MLFRLRSQANTQLTLTLTGRAWQHLLNMAEAHGWNPLGTVQPDWWQSFALGLGVEIPDGPERGYASDRHRMVLLEDALNLADALDSAWLAYEPVRVAYHFGGYPLAWHDKLSDGRPGIGVIQAVMDFCRSGAFWIECC